MQDTLTMLGSKIKALWNTWFTGTYRGQDDSGNRYYESKNVADAFGRKRRWVVYAGSLEPSKVSGSWHGWLHHTHRNPVTQLPYVWQKNHLPNLTGTQNAYFPRLSTPGKAIQDEIWSPPSSKKA